MTTPTTLSLSAAMRAGSMAEHREAEGSSFMAELLDGRLVAEAYAAYLLRLRAVYAALEEVVRAHRDDPLVAAVHDPDLERLDALDADLDHWAPDRATDWAPGSSGVVDSPAAEAYVTRLEAARAWGGLVVAHHYTRYLGDLSGGQAIGRTLERTFALDGAGTAFYRFEAIGRLRPYKDAYRARLDGLATTQDDAERVVAEVQVAFALNQALLDELAARLPEWRRTGPSS